MKGYTRDTTLREITAEQIQAGFYLRSDVLISNVGLDYPIMNVRIRAIGEDVEIDKQWVIVGDGPAEDLIINYSDQPKSFNHILSYPNGTTPGATDKVIIMVEFLKPIL